jgi:hypothetical protein
MIQQVRFTWSYLELKMTKAPIKGLHVLIGA